MSALQVELARALRGMDSPLLLAQSTLSALQRHLGISQGFFFRLPGELRLAASIQDAAAPPGAWELASALETAVASEAAVRALRRAGLVGLSLPGAGVLVLDAQVSDEVLLCLQGSLLHLGAQLARDPEWLSPLLELLGEAVVVIDHDSRITAWSRGAEALLGYRHEQLVGQPLEQIIPERMRMAHRAGMSRYLRTGETRMTGRLLRTEALHASGHEIPIELRISALPAWGTGRFLAVLCDLAERQRMEGARRQAFLLEQRLTRHLLQLTRRQAEGSSPSDRLMEGLSEALGVSRVLLWEATKEGLRCSTELLPWEAAPWYFERLSVEPLVVVEESPAALIGLTGLHVPLNALDGLRGVLLLAAGPERVWLPEEQRFAVEVAGGPRTTNTPRRCPPATWSCAIRLSSPRSRRLWWPATSGGGSPC